MVALRIIHYNEARPNQDFSLTAENMSAIDPPAGKCGDTSTAMNKEELLELAENPEFISGIYNYCDRWCERCPFTSRCFLYATEQADRDLDDPEVHDISNEKFWKKLHSIFANTAELIADWAAEAGIDLDAIDARDAEHEREITEAKQSELSVAAKHYAAMVGDWFKEEFATEESVHTDGAVGSEPEEDVTIQGAVDVVRWYQFFIAVKIFRALSGGRHSGEEWGDEEELLGSNLFEVHDTEEDEDVDYDAVLARADRMDANGSAKVALIAMDRSISAWRALQISLPEKTDSITPMPIELERLRRATELSFPHARDFIRPGLDESTSEFVS
jgi:hypothetical protein